MRQGTDNQHSLPAERLNNPSSIKYHEISPVVTDALSFSRDALVAAADKISDPFARNYFKFKAEKGFYLGSFATKVIGGETPADAAKTVLAEIALDRMLGYVLGPAGTPVAVASCIGHITEPMQQAMVMRANELDQMHASYIQQAPKHLRDQLEQAFYTDNLADDLRHTGDIAVPFIKIAHAVDALYKYATDTIVDVYHSWKARAGENKLVFPQLAAEEIIPYLPDELRISRDSTGPEAFYFWSNGCRSPLTGEMVPLARINNIEEKNLPPVQNEAELSVPINFPKKNLSLNISPPPVLKRISEPTLTIPQIGPVKPGISFSWNNMGGGFAVMGSITVTNPELYLPVIVIGGIILGAWKLLSIRSEHNAKKANDYIKRVYDHEKEIISGGKDSRHIQREGILSRLISDYEKAASMQDPESRRAAMQHLADKIAGDLNFIHIKKNEDNGRIKKLSSGKEKRAVKKLTREMHALYDQEIVPAMLSMQRNAIINASSKEELLRLSQNQSYASEREDILLAIAQFKIVENFSNKNFDNVLEICSTIPNSEYRASVESEARLQKINELFLVAQEHAKNAATVEELEKVAQRFRDVLALAPSHRASIENLANCYLRLGKYQEAIAHVENNILNNKAADVFGLCIKGAAQLAAGEIPAGKSNLEQVLHIDPENQFVHHVLVGHYTEEINSTYAQYVKTFEEKEATTNFAASVYSQQAIPLLRQQMSNSEACLHRIDELSASQQKHVDHINVNVSEASKINKNSNARQQVTKQLADSHQKVQQVELAIPRFQLQTAEMLTDAAFFVVKKAVKRSGKDTQRLQQGLTHVHNAISHGLQYGAHGYTQQLDTLQNNQPPSVVSKARGTLLAARAVREAIAVVESALPASIKNPINRVTASLDNYVFPLGQFALMMAAPLKASSILSMSPEVLLNVPEINRFLLAPDPTDPVFAPVRFVLGKTLLRLNKDNVFSSLAQSVGYVGNFSDPLLAWAKWGLAGVTSEQTAQQLFNALSKTTNTLQQQLETSLSSVKYAGNFASRVSKSFISLNGFYLLLKSGQFALASIRSVLNFKKDWTEYYLAWLTQHFTHGMKLSGDDPTQGALFFTKIKDEIRYGSDPALRKLPEIKKLYLLSLYLEQTFLNKREVINTLPDGNCLFHAIAYYVDYDHRQLRQMAVDYELANRQKVEHLVEGDFNQHIQKMRVEGEYGGAAEIYALTEVLGRVILPIWADHGFDFDRMPYQDISQFSPENPIFIYLEGQHYWAFLVRGEEYFEQSYAKKLATEKRKLAHVVVEPLAVYQAHFEADQQRILNRVNRVDEKIGECQQQVNAVAATQQNTAETMAGIDAMLNRHHLFANLVPPLAPANQPIHFIPNAGLTEEEQAAINQAVAAIRFQ